MNKNDNTYKTTSRSTARPKIIVIISFHYLKNSLFATTHCHVTRYSFEITAALLCIAAFSGHSGLVRAFNNDHCQSTAHQQWILASWNEQAVKDSNTSVPQPYWPNIFVVHIRSILYFGDALQSSTCCSLSNFLSRVTLPQNYGHVVLSFPKRNIIKFGLLLTFCNSVEFSSTPTNLANLSRKGHYESGWGKLHACHVVLSRRCFSLNVTLPLLVPISFDSVDGLRLNSSKMLCPTSVPLLKTNDCVPTEWVSSSLRSWQPRKLKKPRVTKIITKLILKIGC